MMPVVWRIPFINWDIPGYGLMLCFGFLAAILWGARRAARSGANPDVILNCGFIALFAGVIGCRAMYVVHYWDERFAIYGSPGRILQEVFSVQKGGFEFYGGFVLATVSILFYLWRAKVSIRWYMDIMAPSGALGLAIGRIGCFLNGCCYGGQCDLAWKVQFPYGSNVANQHWQNKVAGAELPQQLVVVAPLGASVAVLAADLRASDEEIRAADLAEQEARQAWNAFKAKPVRAGDDAARIRREQQGAQLESAMRNAERKLYTIRKQMKKYNMTANELRALAAKYPSLPVHPTQLYSTVTAGLIALLLSAVYWRRKRDGQVICTLLMIEPISRYLIELIRDDNPLDTLGFTVSQFIAIVITGSGVAGLLLMRRLPARSPTAVLWEPEEQPAPRKGKRARATI